MFYVLYPYGLKWGTKGEIMQFAINKENRRINIIDAIIGEQYYCPCCKSLLVQKKGSFLIWHFAHKYLDNCISYYDNKGEWHRKMQELFPENNREIFESFSSYRHIYDVLTESGIIIEFQHSPISLEDFKKRTKDYVFRSLMNKTPRPIWVFDYTERDFSLSPQRYENSPRRRKLYWKRATDLFGEYLDYKNDNMYELWFYIKPYQRGDVVGEQYGFKQYEKKYKGTGFIKVLGTYNDCKTVIGDIYTEEQFYKYITNL